MGNLEGLQHPDWRRHHRIPTATHAGLHWEGPDGGLRFAQAYCLDISECGVKLEVHGGVPQRGASVRVLLEECGFAEYCTVRYVSPRGFIGAEFRFEFAEREEVERWRKIVGAAESQLAAKCGSEPSTGAQVNLTSVSGSAVDFQASFEEAQDGRSCKYCGKLLTLRRRVAGKQFCGDAHRKKMALERLVRALEPA
jgi:hypothetical protein